MNKKLWAKLLFPLACFIIVIVVIFINNDIKEVFTTLQTVKAKYLWIAILLLVGYFILWPVSLCIIVKSKKYKIKVRDVFLIGSVEHFFNGITPFSTGGQPFEAFCFKRKGMKFSDSSGVLLTNFISYQIIITVFSIIAVFFNYQYLKENVDGIVALVIIGIVINALVLFIFISLGCSKVIRKLFLKIMILLSKIKLLKKLLEPRIESFDEFCSGFQNAFREIMANKIAFLLCLLVKAVTMAVFYAIPFYILKATGIEIGYNKMLFVISMTCFSICMTCWFPTPGASGGIEFAFKTLFASIVGVTPIVAVSGMLIWRFITYYLLMLISFISYLVLEYATKNDIRDHIKGSEIEVNNK